MMTTPPTAMLQNKSKVGLLLYRVARTLQSNKMKYPNLEFLMTAWAHNPLFSILMSKPLDIAYII